MIINKLHKSLKIIQQKIFTISILVLIFSPSNTQIMKTLQTSVSTGDKVEINGKNCLIGQAKRINGKLRIALHFKITDTNSTTYVTEYVSTKKLNQLLKNNPSDNQLVTDLSKNI